MTGHVFAFTFAYLYVSGQNDIMYLHCILYRIFKIYIFHDVPQLSAVVSAMRMHAGLCSADKGKSLKKNTQLSAVTISCTCLKAD